MSEPITPAEPAEPASPTVGANQNSNPQATEAPPWGDDFDAEKAWSLIKNLRADKEKLSGREVLTDDAKAKLAEYDKLVEASKTDADRRDEEMRKLQEGNARIPTLESEVNRLKVALEKGLPASLAGRLQGSTIEELQADADQLLALIPPAGPAAPRTPAPNPAQGTSGGGSPTPEELAAQAAASGDWKASSALKAAQLLHMREQTV